MPIPDLPDLIRYFPIIPELPDPTPDLPEESSEIKRQAGVGVGLQEFLSMLREYVERIAHFSSASLVYSQSHLNFTAKHAIHTTSKQTCSLSDESEKNYTFIHLSHVPTDALPQPDLKKPLV